MARRYIVEQSSCARKLCLLHGFQVHGLHGAFGLSNEEDMLHATLLEGNRPVRRVVADRGGNGEAFRHLRINHGFFRRVQVCHEFALHGLPVDRITVRKHVAVLNCFFRLESLFKRLRNLLCGKISRCRSCLRSGCRQHPLPFHRCSSASYQQVNIKQADVLKALYIHKVLCFFSLQCCILQVAGKLNHAHAGIYFVCFGAVSANFLIYFFSQASFISLEMLAEDLSSKPKRSRRELFVKNSP